MKQGTAFYFRLCLAGWSGPADHYFMSGKRQAFQGVANLTARGLPWQPGCFCGNLGRVLGPKLAEPCLQEHRLPVFPQ